MRYNPYATTTHHAFLSVHNYVLCATRRSRIDKSDKIVTYSTHKAEPKTFLCLGRFIQFPPPLYLLTYLLILIGPARTLKAGQKIAPSIPVCRRCDRTPPPPPPTNAIPAGFFLFLQFFSTFLLGRPRLLLPSGAHVSAVLEMLPGLVTGHLSTDHHLIISH